MIVPHLIQHVCYAFRRDIIFIYSNCEKREKKNFFCLISYIYSCVYQQQYPHELTICSSNELPNSIVYSLVLSLSLARPLQAVITSVILELSFDMYSALAL